MRKVFIAMMFGFVTACAAQVPQLTSVTYHPTTSTAGVVHPGLVTYRPTTDFDTSSPTGVCGQGTYVASGQSMSFAYDSAGGSTSSTFDLDGTGRIWSQRQISGFSHTSGTHSLIQLKIDSACQGEGGVRTCFIAYSTTGTGYSFAHSNGQGWARTTDTVTLPNNIDLANVSVRVCSNIQAGGSADVETTVWDVRAEVTD